MKRSSRLIVITAIAATAVLVPLLWLVGEFRAMRRELADWKAAQVAFVATRPTPEDILPRSHDGVHSASVVKDEDGTIEAVCITGPQWHYAWFKIEAGRAVAVSFSAK